MDNYVRWMLANARGPMGFGAEYWRPVDEHPGFEPVVASRVKAGLPATDATWDLTRGLILDVIDAAGALEDSAEQLDERLQAAQAWADENIAPDLDPSNWPAFGWHFGSHDVTKARWSFASVIAGTRTLLERMDRRDVTSSSRRFGLLPQLADSHPIKGGDLETVRNLKGALPDQRYMANYLLHASAIPYAGAGAHVSKDGKVVLWLPDRLRNSVWSMHEFTYDEDREAASVAHEILEAVVQFMHAMLDRFAYWQENRYTSPGTIAPGS